MYLPAQAVDMPETTSLYSKLLDATGNRDDMYDVAEDIIEAAFDSDSVNIEYKTTNTNLAVGEHTTDPTKFFADTVQVQNLGGDAGAKLFVKGSYYSRANTMDMMNPAPHMEARKGKTVTVNVELTLTVSQRGIEGDGMVLFTEGRN